MNKEMVFFVFVAVLAIPSVHCSSMPFPFDMDMPDRELNAKYVLTFPQIIQSDGAFPFYLVLFENVTEYQLPVSFQANLTVGRSTVLASETFIQDSYGLRRHEFKNLTKGSVADYARISIEFNKTFGQYSTSTSARAMKNRFVFIQTDKAMYKPLQNVKFRIVTLKSDMTAIEGNISVTLTDPKNNIVKSWTDQILNRGIFGGDYQLSDFVTLGDWKITVTGKEISTTTKQFTVAQYVLPKFEVGMKVSGLNELPFFWYNATSDEDYVAYITAKYTFGKPVKGKAAVQLVNTGYCNYYYDNPKITFYSGQKKGNITLLNYNTTLKGDSSEDDGKIVIKGLNRALLFSPYSYWEGRIFYHSSCKLTFEINVTGDLTGEVISSQATAEIYKNLYKIKVHESTKKTAKPGFPFIAVFQVSRSDGADAPEGLRVKLDAYVFPNNDTRSTWKACSRYRDYSDEITPDISIESTTSWGLVDIVAVPPKGFKSVIFKATLVGFPEVTICKTKSPPRTRSGNSLSISLDRTQSDRLLNVGDVVSFTIEASFESPSVFFMIVKNGVPLNYTKLENPVSMDASLTKFHVNYKLPYETAPRFAAAVWINVDGYGEILADAVEIKVDGKMRMNVEASFDPSSLQPGKVTKLNVTTGESNALVALLAVDRSVRLLQSGYDITFEDVMGKVSQGGSSGGYYPIMPLWRCWRCGWWPSWVDSSDANSVFSGINMVIDSNIETSGPQYRFPFLVESGMRAFGPMAPMGRNEVAEKTGVAERKPPSRQSIPDSSSKKTQEPRVRMLFPETWIWNQSFTNSQGELEMEISAPDTVTTWELTAFAIGEELGFGIVQEPATLRVFQKFFVRLEIGQPTLIRGEEVKAKAVVFNYLPDNIDVDLKLHQSEDFEVSVDGGISFSNQDFTSSVNVKANGGSSTPIWIKASKLGKIMMQLTGIGGDESGDSIVKEVLVEPEGEVQYANKPVFLKLSDGEEVKEIIEISKMLKNIDESQIVDDSRLFQLQAIGDILGPAISQLGSQIRLPTGCGEQTMVILAPNVYIYKYLKSVDLLNDELKAKTVGFVQQGYERELGYQRSDGGFSAFGERDSSSSTWLTAFVVRCFSAAKRIVGTEIDSAIMTSALDFIKNQTSKTGKFTEPGRVIHKNMKGGANNEVNLATYIYLTAAESESDMKEYAETRELMLSTAEASQDPYQLALISYALSIKDDDKADGSKVLDGLLQLSTKEGSLTYWTPKGDDNSESQNSYYKTGPSSIETSAYALLAYLNLKGLEDEAIPIGRWLMSKRNSLGGFSSTQDTVVGLQAIAELATKLRSDGQSFNVDAVLKFDDGEEITRSFGIDSANSQILQSFDPARDKQMLKTVEITAKGSGVGLVQLAMKYNVHGEDDLLNSGDFTMKITRESFISRRPQSADPNELDDDEDLEDKDVSLRACVQPTTVETGMILLEVGVPTGFKLNLAQTMAANRNAADKFYNSNLKKIEENDRKLVFYFDSLEDSSIKSCVYVELTRIMLARNVQKPTARVYSYDSPEQWNEMEFSFHGLGDSDANTGFS